MQPQALPSVLGHWKPDFCTDFSGGSLVPMIPMIARWHLAVAELKGMQHVANMTMEVSGDANMVVEEGPQTLSHDIS